MVVADGKKDTGGGCVIFPLDFQKKTGYKEKKDEVKGLQQ